MFEYFLVVFSLC